MCPAGNVAYTSETRSAPRALETSRDQVLQRLVADLEVAKMVGQDVKLRHLKVLMFIMIIVEELCVGFFLVGKIEIGVESPDVEFC